MIQWTVVSRNGVTSSYTQKTLSTGFVRADSVTCKVTPKDGTVFGATVSSSALVISNTAPTVTAVNVGPNPARTATR